MNEVENQLRTLFREAEVELPAEAFAARVSAELNRRQRREILLWTFAGLAALAVFWLLLPELKPAVRTVAVFPRVLLEAATDLIGALAQSPLVYIYGAVLGAGLLLRLRRRFRIRLF
jgi:hypothetical protein